ncbi:hypothetical protein [Hydrogenophaga sp.]|uniref:hypothetical protein n=1 Tax=Hydrogenophaga sp. TaxID=1904254 RepID=UPI003AF9DA68
MYAQFQYDSTQLLLKPVLLTNLLDNALKPEQQQARAACIERVREATLPNPEEGKLLEALATTLPRTMADIEFALYMLMAHLRSPERTEREGKIHNIVAPAFVGIPKSPVLDACTNALKVLGRLTPNSMLDAHLRTCLMSAHMAASAQKDPVWMEYAKTFKGWISDACKRMNLPIGSAAYMLMLQTVLTQPVGMQQGINNWLIQAGNHNLGALITESTKVTGLEADRADALIQILIDGLSDPDAAKTPANIAAIVAANINTLRAEIAEREKQMLLETVAAMQRGVPFGPNVIEIKPTA